MIRTKLTERYGIELPFVSAGMGFIAIPPLAAAVSNAGGLGQLATGAAPPEILRKLISSTRALTGRPFAVNFIIGRGRKRSARDHNRLGTGHCADDSERSGADSGTAKESGRFDASKVICWR
jgi:NAD(P)H-dependent flavin oxidoreductase YrpB (nitropropane dioxygenase family)